MSTNKKFRIQNGADIVGELSINDVTVIGADGKVVAGAIQDAVASLTAADIADLQSQVTAILGTSPETLDTLQEIVTAFQDADTNLVASVASNSSDIATINATLTSGVATPADLDTLDTSVQAELTTLQTAVGDTSQFPRDPSIYESYLAVRPRTGSGVESLLLINPLSPTSGHITLQSPEGSYSIYGGSLLTIPGKLLVGAFGGDTTVSNAGVVFVYDTTDYNKAPTVLQAPTPTEDEFFGEQIRKNDNSVIISAVGGFYVYDINDLTSAPTYVAADASLFSTGNGVRLGGTSYQNTGMVATNTHLYASILQYGNNDTSDGSGALAVFDLQTLSGTPVNLISGNGFYSYAENLMLSQDGTKLYVATGSSPSETGGLYVYSLSSLNSGSSAYLESVMSPENSWYNTQLGSPQDDAFGHSMVETDTKLFVGARFASPGTSSSSYDSQQGSLYVYDKNNLSSSPLEITAPQGGNYNGALSNRFTWSMTKIGDKVYVSDRGDDAWMNNWDTNPNEGKSWVYAYDAENPSSPVSSFNDDQISGTASGFYHFSEIMHDASVEILGAQKSVVDVLNDLSNDVATAKSEAISTASADATSKADAAEASASADATSKADAAEASAKAHADAGDTSLQGQIDIIVGSSPASLDTLQEIVTAFENADGTLTGAVAQNASDIVAEASRATAAESANAAAIAAANSRTSGISTSSGSTDIQMTAELDMDSNNIKNANDVYAARGFIDHIEADDLKVQTGTVDFEGSIVNFGSSTITGSGFGNATKTEVDQHLNISTANAGEFVKWTGTDYEWTDLVSGRLATDQLQIASGGSITATGPGGTFDFQDGIVMLSGSDVRVDTPTDVGQAANKGYVDGVVAATVDAAPAALDTLNELAAALGDDANFSATVTNSIATKADDAATTAALATKADDAATTAALATKEDKTVVDALDLFVKGEPTSAGPVAGAPELGKSTLSTSDFTFPNGVVRSTSGVTGVEIIRPGSEAAAIAITLEVGKTYEVSYRASTWGAMVGSNYMAIIPASVKPTGGHTFNDGYDNNLLFKHYNGQFFPGDEANFQSHHWGNEYEVVETDRIRYITPNVADLHILFWLGGGAFGLADFSIKEYSFGGSPSLDTTVSGVVPAINELHTEINALSSSTTGDKSNLQAQINSEVIRATAAEAANAANIVSETSARSSADAALESDIIGLQNQVGTIIAGSPASLDTLVEIVSAFENADSDLSGVITANGGRLTTAENNITALETDLSAEESARGAGDAALQTQVTAHDGRLTTAEGEIDTLQSQMATRIGTDSDHSAALAVETAARIAGDNANSSEVSLEAATRSAADTQLTSDLSTEVARATQAEGQIASDLAQEVIDRQNADTGLQTQLDFIKENTDPASLDSLTEIVAAFQSADGSITGVVNSNTGRISALESGVVAIEAWNTDNVSEGSINKYWTEQRTKDCLSGGLCITYSSVTGEIKVDEVEAESSLRVAESVASDDADKLGGAAPSHYRIDVYDVNGTIVN